MPHNLSVQKHFEHLASQHRPRHHFDGSSKAHWQTWRDQLAPDVQATLGRMPEPVPRNTELIAQWNEDGLLKQKVVFNVEDGLSATALIFRPESASGRLPAILCCHGHGEFGKDPVMGNRSSAELQASIAQHNYDYGLQMAKAGFVTMAIDWRGFGERDDRRTPHFHDLTGGRDLCNVHHIRASVLGRTLLGMDIHDARCAVDHLCEQDFVDPDRIGVMGLSFGGTMTVWTAISDPRIKAADVICYSDQFANFGLRCANFCGSQITQGLYELCDVSDLQGLIAPRPLLIEIGAYDECFHVNSAMACFGELEKIYEAAGARDQLDLDLFDGGHGWGGNKSVAFFEQNL